MSSGPRPFRVVFLGSARRRSAFLGRFGRHLDEVDRRAVDQALARMLEIDGDAIADHRLHLADTPIGLAGMAHANAREEASGHRLTPRSIAGGRSVTHRLWAP